MAISFEEYKKQRLSGLTPEQAFKQAPAAESEGFSVGRTIANIPGSAGRLVGGIANMAMHPIQTVRAIGSTVVGGVEKLIPGKQAEEASFDQLVSFYKDRYGSVGQFLKTLEEDPVGVLADASTVLGGAGAAVRGAGAVAKTSSVAKAGEAVASAGAKINPINAAGSALSPVASKALPWVARTMEKSNLRLSAVQKRELGTKVNEIADFMAERRIVGTPQQRFDKATGMYDAAEETLDSFFGQIAKGHGVRRDGLIRGLQTLKGQYKNDRDSAVANRQIDSAIATLKKNQPEIIPYQNLNQFKRTTYQNAYNKAGDKVMDDVEHAIGDVAWNHMNEGLKGLKIAGQSYEQFNKNYGMLIQGRKLLKAAIGRPEMSVWTERLLGSLLGFAVGQGPGAIVGAAFGKQAFEALPITAARSAVGAGAQATSGARVPGAVKGAVTPTTAAERISEAQGI